MRKRTAFGIGFLVVGAVTAIVVWTLAGRSQDRGPRFMQAVSCDLVDKQARAFANEQVPDIIRRARANESGGGDENLLVSLDAALLSKEIQRCRLFEAKALDTNIPLTVYFEIHDRLFSELHVFLREWRVIRPTDMPVGDRRLDRLEALRSDLAKSSSAK